MKVLIHALGASMGGAIRHLTNFLPELGKIDTKSSFEILVNKQFPELNLPGNIRLNRRYDRWSSSNTVRLKIDNIDINSHIKKNRFDILVSLTNFGPISPPIPHISFQRNSIYYCPLYLSKTKGLQKIEIKLRRILAVAMMKRASLIITPSNAMTNMIRTVCPEVSEKEFQTLYHGFAQDNFINSLDVSYSQLISDNKGYKFLYPTHAAPHKGFEILFDILSNLKKEGLAFQLYTTISNDDWPSGIKAYETRIAELGLEEEVVFMGRVPQKQMGALYGACDLMIYPSLCESFGFSMIESMGHGLPIVAADTEINREICGNGAMYYAPLNSEHGAKVVFEIFQPENIKRIKLNAEKRVDSFDWSWERYTREFIEIIEEVVG